MKRVSNTAHNYDNMDMDISKCSTLKQMEFLKKCMTLAHRSNLTQKHGCVIVLDNVIISSGYNYKITNTGHSIPQNKNIDAKKSKMYSIHAEISTIKKVKHKDLSRCELYVVRIGPIGNDSCCHTLKYSHPCEECTLCIEEYGIKKVFYSVNSCKN
jgi:deoxycytidylate deaminase